MNDLASHYSDKWRYLITMRHHSTDPMNCPRCGGPGGTGALQTEETTDETALQVKGEPPQTGGKLP